MKQISTGRKKILLLILAAVILAIAIIAGYFIRNSIPVQGNITGQTDTLVLVNKTFYLSSDYVPDELVVPEVPMIKKIGDENRMRKDAAAALEALFKAAEEDGISLYCESGYRSYQMQKDIYEWNKKEYGEEYASKYCALPGKSEHQTGLSMDITNLDYVDDANDKALGESKEGIWLRDHAHQYGFILRYPKDRTDITGYNYEPWHFRYVGTNAAAEIYEKGIVLEEYFTKGITAADIVREYIPKAFDPVVNSDTLEYPGRWKGNVWPGVSQEMERMGWVQYDAMGSAKYYEKEMNGQQCKITVTITEKGGPEEKDATTLLRIGLNREDI